MESTIQEMGNPDLLEDLMMLQQRLSKTDLQLLLTIFWVFGMLDINFFLRSVAGSKSINGQS